MAARGSRTAQRTIDFLERVAVRECRQAGRCLACSPCMVCARCCRNGYHIVAESGSEKYAVYWHWRVYKQKCNPGYIIMKKFYKVNVTEQVNRCLRKRRAFCLVPHAYLSNCPLVVLGSDGDGVLNLGKLVACPAVQLCPVKFADGVKEVLTILPRAVVPGIPLQAEDYVIADVAALDHLSECFVQITPNRYPKQAKFCKVLLCEGAGLRGCTRQVILPAVYVLDLHGGGSSRQPSPPEPSPPPTPDPKPPPSPPPPPSRKCHQECKDALVRLEMKVDKQSKEIKGQKKKLSLLHKEMKECCTRHGLKLDVILEILKERKPSPNGNHEPDRPKLQPGDAVLARFTDDGWYYWGTVLQNLGNGSYLVKDSRRCVQHIVQEDLLLNACHNAPTLEEGKHVIARHIKNRDSYAPGCIMSIDEVQQAAEINFYDGCQGLVVRAEIYSMPHEKYSHDVLHIQRREINMIGQTVVARCDCSGEYYPGKIVDKKVTTEKGLVYVVQWDNGSEIEQIPIHIFSAMNRVPSICVGDFVLAKADPKLIADPELIADPGQTVYLPGQIICADMCSMCVQFYNGKKYRVEPESCFWVSRTYGPEAISYILRRRQQEPKPQTSSIPSWADKLESVQDEPMLCTVQKVCDLEAESTPHVTAKKEGCAGKGILNLHLKCNLKSK